MKIYIYVLSIIVFCSCKQKSNETGDLISNQVKNEDQSYSWIHIDVSKYETKYLKDVFFVKKQSLIKGKSLNEF